MKIFASVLFLFFLTPAFGQGNIKGKLVDTLSGSPISFATITVFQANDTSIITYRLSNETGDFKVPGIPLNIACRVIISFSGYEAFRKEFTLQSDSTFDLGTVLMFPSSKTLEEVLVVAERPPVSFRRDTIEFNAASFKTLPTSLVEDLLRKLPGVQVDREGNITANGRRVNRITVDGKSFFGDDPKMATRNLPANVIDKIQLAEDKDEANRNTDGDLTNVGQVINLTLKKGVKKGWFGKAYAGAGTEDRYEVGGIANIYRDTLQLSVLGFSNNMNRSGFSFKEVQDMGGFNRSGFNSVMMTNRGGQTGFALNGISFGGLDQGLAKTSGAGFNLNHAPSKKQSLYLQYFFGNSTSFLDQKINNQQNFNDTIVNTRTRTQNNKTSFTHNFGAGGMLKPDTLTDINFRAALNFSNIEEDVLALINVLSNKKGALSDGQGDLFNTYKSVGYNHNVFLTKRFSSKKGRTLNFSNNTNYNKNNNDYITESNHHYYQPVGQDNIFEQLRTQITQVLNTNFNLSFAEPLTQKLTLRLNNNFQYIHDEQVVDIYEKDLTNSKYEIYKEELSSGSERRQNRFNTNLSLAYKINQLTLTIGINGLWQKINNEFRVVDKQVDNKYFNILPNFSLQYKRLTFQYNENVTAPHISNLNPVPDSTNPFYIRYGSMTLQPAKRRSFYLNNFNFLQTTGTSYNIYAGGGFTDNDVVMKRTVNSNGVQTVVPVNVNGSMDFYGGIGFGKEFKNKQKFIFSFRFSPQFNYDKRKIIVNENISTATTFRISPTLNIGLNWNDKVEFRPQYSPGIQKMRYTDPSFKNIQVITHYLESELIIRWPKRLVWETNMIYRYNDQVAIGLPKENILWNASVTLLMFKGDVGLLKLGVFDLLDRNNAYFRYTNQNQVIDQESNVLQRYASMSFTYNIRNMGAAKKVGGKDRLFIF
jgi:hypothetical protein